MQELKLDLSIKKGIDLVYAKQRDVGSKICINLTDNEAEYVVPDDVTWSVWYSGAGVEGNYDKIDGRDAVVVNGSTATVELIYLMLDNPGPGEMCLVMNSADGTQLGLWNIPYFVEAIPGADSKAATAYYQAFLQAQAKAEAAAERSEEAAERAEAAAGASIIVSLDEGEYATHTAVEIYDAMQNGQNVVFTQTPRLSENEFIPLKLSTPSKAVFSKTGYPTEFDVFNIEINAQGNVSYKASFSSELVAQAVEKVEADKAPVSYLPQDPTEEQKEQARENIGAEKAHGIYELIEAFTLETGTTLERTQEPDGTPYRLERLLIKASAITDTYTFFTNTIQCNGTNIAYLAHNFTANQNGREYGITEAFQECGYWRSISHTQNHQAHIYSYVRYGGTDYTAKHAVSKYPYITRIIGAVALPCDVDIEIWGVRANA